MSPPPRANSHCSTELTKWVFGMPWSLGVHMKARSGAERSAIHVPNGRKGVNWLIYWAIREVLRDEETSDEGIQVCA